MNNQEVIEEAISLTEALVSKANIYSDIANTKIIIIPGSMQIPDKLVIIVQDTVMLVVPMRNHLVSTNPFSSVPNIYGAGSGIHMNGLDVYDQRIMEHVYSKYRMYTDSICGKLPLVVDNELRNNDEFENLLNLKADQGLRYYQIPDLNNPGECYMIPMFAGFLSLNKSDTVGVEMYDLDEVNHLIKFNIYKKKISRNVEMYCRTIKI